VVAPPIRTAAITANEDFFNGIGQNRKQPISNRASAQRRKQPFT
jgi:hypothetical protein